MNSIIIKASLLRDKNELNKIDKKRPGYYKWWATKRELQIILDKLELSFESIKDALELHNELELYCIYVGIAVKESVKARLNWHINQSHTGSQVRNGTLSTLRKTISSLVGKNMLDKEATNNFIDELHVEYFLSENEIKSEKASKELHNIERALLNSNYLYILNIQENKHPCSQSKKLKLLRKISKEASLK